ncbi:MAG: AraC family transcriptional regulator ligand-binding domain-containing protein [Pseudomonadales bacterium]|nr:AraC family transcriptional regulator ligand-binding domain-containing protein [Pseudomonadales bacterium]MCP5191471.1 AraC family transcriptional regulator ligand-binding domain-containing protein [Pseudomonadales bacterium]
MAHFGADVDAVFNDLRLERYMFSDPDQLVALRDAGSLLARAVEVTGYQRLPFYLAESQDLSYLGTFGLLLQTSGTVGEVLREIQDYHQIHIQAATWTLTTTARTASLNFWVDVQDVSPLQRRLTVELALAQAFLIVKTLVGSTAYLERVRVRYDFEEGRQTYRRFFHAPVEFNQEVNALDFPMGLLDRPVSPNNAALHEVVRQQISSLDLSGRQTDLVHDVRVIIRRLLPTGQCTVERVARYYHCDKRTLQRYLREESDTTYQALLDEVRFDLIQNYLRDSTLPMTQLAQVAGYTDTSNFSRAFQKRFGMSPRDWREEHSERKPSTRKRRLATKRPVL